MRIGGPEKESDLDASAEKERDADLTDLPPADVVEVAPATMSARIPRQQLQEFLRPVPIKRPVLSIPVQALKPQRGHGSAPICPRREIPHAEAQRDPRHKIPGAGPFTIPVVDY